MVFFMLKLLKKPHFNENKEIIACSVATSTVLYN